VISIGNHLLSFVYNFIMTIMEKNAIWFIVFLEISWGKFIWDGKYQRAEVRRMFFWGLFFGKLWYSKVKTL